MGTATTWLSSELFALSPFNFLLSITACCLCSPPIRHPFIFASSNLFLRLLSPFRCTSFICPRHVLTQVTPHEYSELTYFLYTRLAAYASPGAKHVCKIAEPLEIKTVLIHRYSSNLNVYALTLWGVGGERWPLIQICLVYLG